MTWYLSIKARPHVAMKWAVFLRFLAFRSIADHRRLSQASPEKSQQCGQCATHDDIFELSPAMYIAAMVIRIIKLRNLCHILQDSLSNAYHHAENRLRIGQ